MLRLDTCGSIIDPSVKRTTGINRPLSFSCFNICIASEHGSGPCLEAYSIPGADEEVRLSGILPALIEKFDHMMSSVRLVAIFRDLHISLNQVGWGTFVGFSLH